MMRRQTCDRCGAKFDVSSLQAGDSFTCGACGQVLEVSEPAPPSRAPRRTGKRGSPRPAVDPVAKARVKAAKLCQSSLYASIVAGIFIFLPFFGGVPAIVAALAAIVVGTLGLVGLARVGLGDAGPEAAPLERVGARMARRARPQAFVGIAIGVGLIGVTVLLVVAAGKAAEHRRESSDAFVRAYQAQLRDAEDGGERAEIDAVGWQYFAEHVMPLVPPQGLEGVPGPYDDEILRWANVLLVRYPDTSQAQDLMDPEAELTYAEEYCRSLLQRHPWTTAAERRRQAIQTLLDAMEEGRDPWPHAEVLAEIDPPAVEAMARLQTLAAEGGHTGMAARHVVRRLGERESR